VIEGIEKAAWSLFGGSKKDEEGTDADVEQFMRYAFPYDVSKSGKNVVVSLRKGDYDPSEFMDMFSEDPRTYEALMNGNLRVDEYE
jgi:hypothetical protein